MHSQLASERQWQCHTHLLAPCPKQQSTKTRYCLLFQVNRSVASICQSLESISWDFRVSFGCEGWWAMQVGHDEIFTLTSFVRSGQNIAVSARCRVFSIPLWPSFRFSIKLGLAAIPSLFRIMSSVTTCSSRKVQYSHLSIYLWLHMTLIFEDELLAQHHLLVV